MNAIGRLLPLLVIAALVGLNLVEFDRGSIAFNPGKEEFSQARGWPFSAVARANDEGAVLVEASVVQGDTRVTRDVFDGPYPHLAWNPFFLAMDLIVAIVILLVAWLLARWIRKDRPDVDAGGGPT